MAGDTDLGYNGASGVLPLQRQVSGGRECRRGEQHYGRAALRTSSGGGTLRAVEHLSS